MKILLFLFLLGAVQFFSLIRTRSGRCSCCALILILLSPRAVDFRFLTSVSLWFPLAFFFGKSRPVSGYRFPSWASVFAAVAAARQDPIPPAVVF
jgi:hypothetical protein